MTDKSGFSKVNSEKFVDALEETVKEALSKGESI
ncbi:hypothetical protein [uncultured Sunxiuqinia sp.]